MFHKILSLSIVFSLLICITANAQAQKTKISDTQVTYAINAEGAMAAAMSGSTMDLFFTTDKTKLVTSMMGGMVKMDIRMDIKKNKGIMLMDMMGQKKAVEMTEELLDKGKNAQPQYSDVKYLKNYKTIAGYKCQEVKVKMEGLDEPAIVFVTDKIESPVMGDMQMMQFTNLNGFPLSWQIKQQGMTIIMEASSVVQDKIPAKEFDTALPEGYEKMSMEDLEKMGMGM